MFIKHQFVNAARIEIHGDWTEFYPNSQTYEKYTNNNSKLEAKENSYYVSSCFFTQVNTKGSIYLYTKKNTIKFLIDTTTFNNCSNNQAGGCIFYSQEGEFVQDRVCSFASKVNSLYTHGVYCKIDVSNSNTYKNYIYDSSISKSLDEHKDVGWNNLYLINGQIEIKSINISFSKLWRRDFYEIDSVSKGSNCSFSTFSNSNGISGNPKFCHLNSQENFEIRNCNILNNIGILLWAESAPFYIKNCSFINNNDNNKYYFYGNITLDGCFIDNKSPKTKEGTVIFINNITNEFIHKFSHFSTANCLADIPIQHTKHISSLCVFLSSLNILIRF